MAKKKTTVKGRRASNLRTRAAKSPARAVKSSTTRRATPARRTKSERNEQESGARPEQERRVPMEHFRGERNRGNGAHEAGSLDEETLDRGAPFNKTYGR
jgi:hypothetical protein